MANADLKRALQCVPEIPNERYARIWQAIAERTISEQQKNRVRVSGLIDGELPDSERSEARKFLDANPELMRDSVAWKKLAAATAALPVPQISDAAARKTAIRIAQRTQVSSENKQRMIEAVGDAATTPAVSPERWQQVWRGIEGRVQKKAGNPAARTVPILSAVPERKIVSHRRWRWVLAATAAAAMIAIAALLQLGGTDEETNTVAAAKKLPNALDERYESSLEVINGESVVCFYLKPQSSESGGDSRWLPD